jgi:hypothetical protein
MSEDQGKTYATFIEAQLKAENDLRTSINTRAGTALTGAAGLVTLIIAVFAVFLGKDFTLEGDAKVCLLLAVVSLLAAAVCAVLAQLPGEMKYALTPSLLSFIDHPRWAENEIDARNRTAYVNLQVLDSLRITNDVKVKWLIGAGCCQIAAVLFLGLCVFARLSDIQP